MTRFIVHYGIHFLVPVLIALFFFRSKWLKVLTLLWAGIIIDIDHLLAEPVFDANRCSIGFHPLHSYLAIGAYLALFWFRKTRIIGLALLIHIMADICDCLFLRFQS